MLVEGAPGLAKTRAIKVLSEGIEGEFHRIQFTPDLLPADLTGTEIYRPQDGSFVFQQGPLFNNLIALPAGMLVMEKATASIFMPQNVPETFAADTAAALVLRPAEFHANSEDVTDLEAFVTQQAPRLPEIKVPVAIVSGDHDGVVYTHIHSEGSLRAIAGATLKLLPGVGHAPHFTNTADVVAAAEEVADRINQRKTTPSVMSDAVK